MAPNAQFVALEHKKWRGVNLSLNSKFVDSTVILRAQIW